MSKLFFKDLATNWSFSGIVYIVIKMPSWLPTEGGGSTAQANGHGFFQGWLKSAFSRNRCKYVKYYYFEKLNFEAL